MVERERLVSAAEFDAIQSRLLGGVSAGAARVAEPPAAAGLYHVYDWARPEKLKGDQLRMLTSIHEAYSRILGAQLSAYLRLPVEGELVEDGMVPMSYGEYQEQAVEGNLFHVIYAPPLPAPFVLELEAALGLVILDRLLGGTGRAVTGAHEITDMERVLLQERVVAQALEAFREAWADIVDLAPDVNQTDTNISYLAIALPSDFVVIVTTRLRFGDVDGLLRLCLPYATIEPVKDQLSTQRLLEAGGERSPETAADVRRQLDHVRLSLCALLGDALVSLDDLLQLQVGDVIPLDTPVGGEVDVLVGGKLRFKGVPGLARNHNAVRVTRIIEQSEAEDENVE